MVYYVPCALGSWSFKEIWLWSFPALATGCPHSSGLFLPSSGSLLSLCVHLPSLGLAAFLECFRVSLGGQSHMLSTSNSLLISATKEQVIRSESLSGVSDLGLAAKALSS